MPSDDEIENLESMAFFERLEARARRRFNQAGEGLSRSVQWVLQTVGFSRSEEELINDRKEMRALLLGAWEQGSVGSAGTGAPNAQVRASGEVFAGRPLRRAYHKLANVCNLIAESSKFQSFVTVVIIIAGLQVGIGTWKDLECDEKVCKWKTFAEREENKPFFDVLEEVVTAIFAIEVVLKIIANDDKPMRVLRSRWNTFDIVVVLGSAAGGGSLIILLRLLRLLRVLKLIKSLPQLQVIVSALVMAGSSVGFIGLILFIFFYVFAIIGIMLFRENDPWHFGSLHLALLSLFRASTLEDWTDIMYINMLGCDQYGYDGMEAQCTHPTPTGTLAMIYFIFIVVVGALIMLTLFVGVVTTSMEQAKEETESEINVEKRLIEFKKLEGLSKDEVNNYRQVFAMLDLDGGGTISEAELKTGLEAIGKKLNDSQIHFMMSQVDANSNGEIDMAEFVEFLTYMRRGIISTHPSHHDADEKDEDASEVYLGKIAGAKTGNAAFDQQRLDQGLNQWALLLGLGEPEPSTVAPEGADGASGDAGPAQTSIAGRRGSSMAAGCDKYGIPCLKMAEDPASTLDSLDSMLAGVSANSPGATTPSLGRARLPPLTHSPVATTPAAAKPQRGRASKVHAASHEVE